MINSDDDDESGAPLGSWRAFHGLVLGILVALIAAFSVVSWMYK
jgi:hypothetical protein